MGDLKQTMLSRGGYFEGTDQAYPEHFGNPAAEVAAARSSVVAIDRSSRGKLAARDVDEYGHPTGRGRRQPHGAH